LKLDPDGFVETKATLESPSHEGIFAAGDVAAVGGYSLPKAGVYAVRQGPVLAENLWRAVSGKRLKTYRPQRNVLALISTGEPYAIGTRNGITFEGAWVWRWKDWIDRRFMRKFNEFPEMQTARSKVSMQIADKGRDLWERIRAIWSP
jgi:selenide,water dikinase